MKIKRFGRNWQNLMVRTTLNIGDTWTPKRTALDLHLESQSVKTAYSCTLWFLRSYVSNIFEIFKFSSDVEECYHKNVIFCRLRSYGMWYIIIDTHFIDKHWILGNDPLKWPNLTWLTSMKNRSRSLMLCMIYFLT